MKDRNIAAKTAREIRLPVVLKYWCQHKSSYEIVPFVAAECGQNVNARTIQRDIEYLRTRAVANANEETEKKIADAIAVCDNAIAELWSIYYAADNKTKYNSVKSVVRVDKTSGEQKQTPTNSFSSSMTPDNVRKTKVLAEIREWEKMRNALMGIDVKHIDIKSDGKSFTGFASVLPVMPNIEQIIAQVDARRRENADEGDN